MKKLIPIVLFTLFILILSSFSYCEENDSKVIDLGEMSVTGEVRKPSIQWIDSQKSVKEHLPSLLKGEFERFEEQLLRPSSLSDESKSILKSQENSHVRN